MSPLKKL